MAVQRKNSSSGISEITQPHDLCCTEPTPILAIYMTPHCCYHTGLGTAAAAGGTQEDTLSGQQPAGTCTTSATQAASRTNMQPNASFTTKCYITQSPNLGGSQHLRTTNYTQEPSRLGSAPSVTFGHQTFTIYLETPDSSYAELREVKTKPYNTPQYKPRTLEAQSSCAKRRPRQSSAPPGVRVLSTQAANLSDLEASYGTSPFSSSPCSIRISSTPEPYYSNSNASTNSGNMVVTNYRNKHFRPASVGPRIAERVPNYSSNISNCSPIACQRAKTKIPEIKVTDYDADLAKTSSGALKPQRLNFSNTVNKTGVAIPKIVVTDYDAADLGVTGMMASSTPIKGSRRNKAANVSVVSPKRGGSPKEVVRNHTLSVTPTNTPRSRNSADSGKDDSKFQSTADVTRALVENLEKTIQESIIQFEAVKNNTVEAIRSHG